jgi:hypothetical protein
MLELEAVKKLLPKTQRNMITQEFLDRIEASVNNPDIAEHFKDNFITYLNVLSTGKYKMEDYISAVKYVSLKLLGYTNIKAYATVFPDRYARLKREGQQVDAFVAAYNKTKLVMKIYEQTIVPTYVLNAPLHQEILDTLAKMIRDDSVKGMAKVKACEAILNYTKAPEVVKGELTIGIEQNDTITDLREVVESLSNMQKTMLEKGSSSLKKIAESNIIDVSVDDE